MQLNLKTFSFKILSPNKLKVDLHNKLNSLRPTISPNLRHLRSTSTWTTMLPRKIWHPPLVWEILVWHFLEYQGMVSLKIKKTWIRTDRNFPMFFCTILNRELQRVKSSWKLRYVVRNNMNDRSYGRLSTSNRNRLFEILHFLWLILETFRSFFSSLHIKIALNFL